MKGKTMEGFVTIAEFARMCGEDPTAIESAVALGLLPAPQECNGQRGWPAAQVAAIEAIYAEIGKRRHIRPDLLEAGFTAEQDRVPPYPR